MWAIPGLLLGLFLKWNSFPISRNPESYSREWTQKRFLCFNYLTQLAVNFTADAPNRIWVSDITFIPTRKGWLYLAVVVDLYSRRVIGWSMSNRINQHLTIDALSMAIRQRNPESGLIHHSDQGIQYRGTKYQTILKTHNMIASMSRKGNCYDNAIAESFFSNLKNELVYHCDYYDRDEARAAVFKYIEVFYYRKLLHQTLAYISPAQYEALENVA
jgi:putative transposase